MSNIHMNTELMHDVLQLAEPKEVKLDSRTYTTRPVHAVKEPLPSELKVSTLTAVKDYLVSNRDRLDLETLIIHVSGPTEVRVLSTLLGDFRERATHLRAVPRLPDYAESFNRTMGTDTFIPLLQSLFLPNEHRDKLLMLVSNVQLDEGANLKDDGMTQTVTVKKGARFENESIPNPVTLFPYCTFPDVEQPERMFTFRMNADGGCKLIEADGGAWKQVAALSVKDWLDKELAEALGNDISMTVIA